MSVTAVIVLSVLITIVVLFLSVWVVIKGYSYKHTIDTDDEVNTNYRSDEKNA